MSAMYISINLLAKITARVLGENSIKKASFIIKINKKIKRRFKL